jgi:hypothetical protein
MLDLFIRGFKWASQDFELMTRKRDGSDLAYLARWMLLPKNRYFNVFLHEFLASDLEGFHDHPCDWLLIGLSGWYLEIRPDGLFLRKAGQWRVMTAETFHRVVVSKQEERVFTLAIRGPTRKPWGFLQAGPESWTRWAGGAKKVTP